MTDQVRVVDGEAPERSLSSAPRSGWALFALGVLVGMGAAVVFITPAGAPSPTDTTSPGAVASPTAPVRPEPAPSGIGEVIEGFPDAMVSVLEQQGRGLTHFLWPVAGAPVERPLPAGGFGSVRFDVSGRWMASTTDLPDRAGALLSMGISSSFGPLVSGVTSFAWHDGESGSLAYIRSEEGMTSLWVVRPNRRPLPVLEGLGSLVTVQTWGDWGFALQDHDPTVFLLYNQDGEQRATLAGVAYGSHPSGWIVAWDGELMLVSAGGGVNRLSADLERVGSPIGAEVSPDRTMIALRGDRGILVVDADTGETVATQSVPGESGDMVWSSDSRFVLFPHFRGALVVDRESGSMETVLGGRTVMAVSVIPLSGS